jgi:hypothetical protein
MDLHDQPVPDLAGVDPAFTALLRRAMSREPAARPPSAGHLRDAIRALTPDHPKPVAEGSLGASPSSVALLPPPSEDGVAVPAPSGWFTQLAGPRVEATPSAPSARPRLRRRLLVTGTVAAAVVAGAALLAAPTGLRSLAEPGRADAAGTAAPASSEPAPDAGTPAPRIDGAGFPIPTVVEGCPAARIPGSQAECPATPECWAGLVYVSGAVASAPLVPCEGPHAWETFAIGPLPPRAATPARALDFRFLQRQPAVRAACATTVLMASRRGSATSIPRRDWEVSVLPPTRQEYEAGQRVYRCLGGVLGDEPPTSMFGPDA